MKLGENGTLKNFLNKCGPCRPQLIILDGHNSHQTLGILPAAMSAIIHILALPPHATHYTQPFDKSPAHWTKNIMRHDHISSKKVLCIKITRGHSHLYFHKPWRALLMFKTYMVCWGDLSSQSPCYARKGVWFNPTDRPPFHSSYRHRAWNQWKKCRECPKYLQRRLLTSLT